MYRTDWIDKWAQYSPEKIAISEYESDRTITYGNLNLQANALSEHFTRNLGFEIGDRLMVLAEHCIEYVVLFSMAQKTGITLVPVNYRLAAAEMDYMIRDGAPKWLIAERKFEDKIQDLGESVPVIWLDELQDIIMNHPDNSFEAVEIEEDHPVFILYTSGSTGFPKGAIYSHKMLLWNSLNTTQSLELTPSDQTINCMPPFHTGGWNVLLTPMLHRGASVGLLKKFDAEKVMQLIDQEGSNLFMGVPTMLKMMSESPYFERATFKSIRYFIVGGEALPLGVIRSWHEKGVKIRQGYGLTEVGPNITSLHQNDAERKIGSIGITNFYVQHQILDDDGKPVKTGEIGEFCLKGPMVTPGYWRNPEATAKSIVDGFFRTGDLVRQDDQGFIYVVDRKKSMFISGGENVYPAEVERVIGSHKSVDEVAVVGVPDERWGEVGKAYITMRTGVAFDEEALREYCLAKLAKFKVPKFFECISEMPKNGSGKIDRKTLTALS